MEKTWELLFCFVTMLNLTVATEEFFKDRTQTTLPVSETATCDQAAAIKTGHET